MILFITGVVLGGLASWFITHIYYVRAGAEQREELDKLKKELKPRNTLENFERNLVEVDWGKSVIEFKEVWICLEDNTYQIHVGEQSTDFSERWTSVYPDQNAYSYPVYLKIANTTIKELIFVSVDGGRIFVPLPGQRPAADGEFDYFWNPNSLEVKVCRVIGSYYRYVDLEEVASRSGVTIIE